MVKHVTTFSLALLLSSSLSTMAAEEKRQLDAHEHGVGNLNIAIEGSKILLEIEAPGADIVGFEYEAKADADKKKIANALKLLGDATTVVSFPSAAQCSVASVSAELIGDDDHDEHDDHKDEHDDHKDEHDDHKDEHDDHKDEHHDEHSEDEGENHTEFHAEYTFNCTNISAVDSIELIYFATFPNANELEVQLASASTVTKAELTRANPTLAIAK